MPSLLMDLETGDPYIDPELGTPVEVDDETAVKQIIYLLFNTIPGSEILNPYYGFDEETAVRLSNYPDSDLIIESLVADALDPSKERIISNVNLIKVTKDLENRRMYIDVDLTTINSNEIEFTTEIEL